MSRNYCILRDDPLLIHALKRRIIERKFMLKDLASELGIPSQKISTFLSDKKYDNRFGLTQLEVLTLCDKLGIKPRLKIELIN